MSAKSPRPIKIAKYEIKRRIGRGAMGIVYEAFDPFVQRTVAIKVAHSASDMDDATKQKQRESFFAEVYSAGRMHHPSVVSVYDAGQEEDLNYIVMEFVDGQIRRAQKDPHLTEDQVYRRTAYWQRWLEEYLDKNEEETDAWEDEIDEKEDPKSPFEPPSES